MAGRTSGVERGSPSPTHPPSPLTRRLHLSDTGTTPELLSVPPPPSRPDSLRHPSIAVCRTTSRSSTVCRRRPHLRLRPRSRTHDQPNVFSLSVSAYVGTPPNIRSAPAEHHRSERLSRSGTTTRTLPPATRRTTPSLVLTVARRHSPTASTTPAPDPPSPSHRQRQRRVARACPRLSARAMDWRGHAASRSGLSRATRPAGHSCWWRRWCLGGVTRSHVASLVRLPLGSSSDTAAR